MIPNLKNIRRNLFELDKEDLLIAWLSDKVVYDLKNESLAEKVLKVAEQKIQYKKKIN